MVEVFKTNVTERDQADKLLNYIHACHKRYIANFDLDDCDRILRVEVENGFVDIRSVINIIQGFGFEAEILSDDKPVDQFLRF